MMKMGVIGGGSIGLLFAYYLSRVYPVSLYVRTNEQKEFLEQHGLVLERGTKEEKTALEVKLVTEWRGDEDVTFIAVKQYQLQSVTALLQKYSKAGHALVFLQNGMGHVKWFDRLQGDIYAATVEHGAMRKERNRVSHTGVGVTKIAKYRQENSRFLPALASQFEKIFPFMIEENYETMLLKKLVVNAVINPLTAVLRVKNGELIKNPYYFQLAELLFTEIEQSLGLQEGKSYFAHVQEVCVKTGANQSSMLRDLEEGRPTEIDAILGYILEKAGEREINTPIMKAFYCAVKGKECKVEG